MNDTLKVAGRIGAELGAAKAELERLSHKLERARDHLTHARHDVEIRANAGNDAARLVLKGIDQWLSDYDQSPDDTYTAVEMATAAAQGFRDGQAAVDPAPAQDEQQPEQIGLYTCIGKGGAYELIGRATTAGVLKVTGRFADEVIVYRDTESNALYCREPGDFRLRMARAALSTPSPAKRGDA